MPDVSCGFDDIPGGATGASLLVGYGPTLLVDIGFDADFKPKAGHVPVSYTHLSPQIALARPTKSGCDIAAGTSLATTLSWSVT